MKAGVVNSHCRRHTSHPQMPTKRQSGDVRGRGVEKHLVNLRLAVGWVRDITLSEAPPPQSYVLLHRALHHRPKGARAPVDKLHCRIHGERWLAVGRVAR